ncbi:MAG: GxxExxY protein [Chitinophagaceae bacterium]|nr:GxxExxY protein [Chitinophagaceae bacterium]
MSEFYYPELSKIIMNTAYKVHSLLGPGLLESTYEACLEYELKENKCSVKRQVLLPLTYKGMVLQDSYRIDLLVEEKIIIELKSVETLSDVHFKQLLTYLRLSNIKVGYLINFNVISLKGNIFRKVV